MMMWVIGFSSARNYVCLDGLVESTLSVMTGTDLKNCVPRIKVGEVSYTVYEFTIFVLFEAGRTENMKAEVVDFRHMIEEKLKNITKNTMYEGIQNSFEADVTKIYGKEGNNKRAGKKASNEKGSGVKTRTESKARSGIATRSSGHVTGQNLVDDSGIKPCETKEPDDVSKNKKGTKRKKSDWDKKDGGSNKKSKEKSATSSAKKNASKEKGRKKKQAKKTTSKEKGRKKKQGLKSPSVRSDKMPSVRSVHLDPPPPYIDMNNTGWYWDFGDSHENKPWYHNISLESVSQRIQYNLCRLSYINIALWYARAHDANSGYELHEILATPGLCEDEEEIEQWEKILRSHELFWLHFGKEGGIVKQLLPRRSPDDESFYEYFSAMIELNKLSREVEETHTKTNKAATFEDALKYWDRSNVDCFETFDRNTVLAIVHNLRCSVVFDCICRTYFHGRRKKDLTAALLNHPENEHVYPRDMAFAKKQWDQDFNMVIHGLQQLEIFAEKDKPFGTKKRKGDVFLDTLTFYTIEMRVLAGEHQKIHQVRQLKMRANSGPRPTLSEAKVKTPGLFERLKRLFFGSDGYLRYDLRDSLNFGPKSGHGFIRFDGYNTCDERWFMPFITVNTIHQGKYLNHLYDGNRCLALS